MVTVHEEEAPNKYCLGAMVRDGTPSKICAFDPIAALRGVEAKAAREVCPWNPASATSRGRG
jgi:hypothetical protein